MLPTTIRAPLHRAGALAALAIATAQTNFAAARQFDSLDILGRFGAVLTNTDRNARLIDADFNADGRRDLLVRTSEEAPAATRLPPSIWLGSPAGLIGPIAVPDLPPAPVLFMSASSYTTANFTFAAADVTGDARDDIIATVGAELVVYASNGAGGFNIIQTLPNPGLFVHAIDIDHDADPDIVTGRPLKVSRNDNGVLQPFITYPTPPWPDTKLVFGKFTAGPGPDIFTNGPNALFINDGHGVFTLDPRPPFVPDSPISGAIAAIDTNADGRDELICTANGGLFLPQFGRLAWWMQPTPSRYLFTIATLTDQGFAAGPFSPSPFDGPYTLTRLGPDRPFGSDFIVAANGEPGTNPYPTQFAFARIESGALVVDPAFPAAGIGAYNAVAGDFTADGCADVAIWSDGTRRVGPDMPASLAIARGDCAATLPTLAAPRSVGWCTFYYTQGLFDLRFFDADADGRPDLHSRFLAGAFPATTNAISRSQLIIRNLGNANFNFERPVYIAGQATLLDSRRVFLDLNRDALDELYAWSDAGLHPVVKIPISAVPQAIPRFWDQAFALEVQSTPRYPAPTPTDGYSNGFQDVSVSRAPLNPRMAFDADADAITDLVTFQNQRQWNTPGDFPSRIVVQSPGQNGVHSAVPVRLASVAAIDFDNDGDTDLVGVERLSGPAGQPSTDCAQCRTWTSVSYACDCLPAGTLKVFLNDGHANFTPLNTSIPTPPYSDRFRPTLNTADVTGDGRPDLALTNWSTAQVWVYPAGPNGLGEPPVITATATGIENLAIADIDRDADADMVVGLAIEQFEASAGTAPETLLSFLSDGTGGFHPGPPVAAGVTPEFPRLADFDNDADPDLAFLSAGSQIITTINRTPPACSADLNTDGTVTVADLTILINHFGQPLSTAGPAARIDINHNHIIDTPDLVYFIARCGETCP